MDTTLRHEAYCELAEAMFAAKCSWASLIEPSLETARYRLGTGVADRILPYVLDPDIRQLVRRALTELACLYISRNRRFLGEEAYDSVLLTPDEPVASLRPVSYHPPVGLQNPVMRQAMLQAPRILPGFDAGLLATWWGMGGKGRELLMGWSNLFFRSVSEMISSASGERTPYLLVFAMLDCFTEPGEVLRPFDLDEPVRQEVHAALLLGLHLCHHVVRSQLKSDTQPGQVDAILHTQWGAVCNPRVHFLHAPDLLRLCRFYPVPLDILGGRRETFVSLVARSGPAKAEAALRGWLDENDKLRHMVESLLVQAWVRERLLGLLASGLPEDGPGWRFCQAHLRDVRALATAIEDRKARKDCIRILDAAGGGGPAPSPRTELLAFLQRYNPKTPAKKVFGDGQVVQRAAESLVAWAGDKITFRIVSDVRKHFSLRTGEETDRTLADEYEAGRLYRFGLTVSPFLRQYQQTLDVGHYFIDVKDYTRRTALLGEEVMADFIRREFYEPILGIVQDAYRGMPQLGDRGGVHLNNLLGDAVSFSGDVVALVGIAHRIRAHLDAFADSLSRGLGESAVAARIKTVEERFAMARARIEAAGGNVAGALSKLEEAKEEALGRITGQKLVAGSFISFGAAPSVVAVEAPAWGKVQVSIGDKINESARGTARVGAVLASVQARLAHQRRRQNNFALQLPFRVYVGNTLGFVLAPEAEVALREALVHRDMNLAVSIFQKAAREHAVETLSGGQEAVEGFLSRGMALHNAGDALSGEALRAYIEARRGELHFTDRNVPVARLDPDLLRRFAFFRPTLRVVVGRAKGGEPEIFRYAGTVVFKGFERDAPTEVWEMVNPSDLAGRALARSASVVSSG